MPGGRIIQEHTHHTSTSPCQPTQATSIPSYTFHPSATSKKWSCRIAVTLPLPWGLSGAMRAHHLFPQHSTLLCCHTALHPSTIHSCTTSTSLRADSLWTTTRDNSPLLPCVQQKQLKNTNQKPLKISRGVLHTQKTIKQT
eukprot:6456443-Amphidinium_carterae.1